MGDKHDNGLQVDLFDENNVSEEATPAPCVLSLHFAHYFTGHLIGCYPLLNGSNMMP